MAKAPVAIDENGNILIPKNELEDGKVYFMKGKAYKISGKSLTSTTDGEYEPAVKEEPKEVKAAYEPSELQRYSSGSERLGRINELLDVKNYVLEPKDRTKLEQEKQNILTKRQERKPFVQQDINAIQAARQGENTIEKAGTAGAIAGEIAAQLPLMVQPELATVKGITAGSPALGILGQTGAEVGRGIGEDIAQMVTGVRKGDAMRELGAQRGYPDIYQLKVISSTPEMLMQSDETGNSPLSAVKQLPEEYKAFLLDQLPPNSQERTKAYTALYGTEANTPEQMAMLSGATPDSQQEFMGQAAIGSAANLVGGLGGKAIGSFFRAGQKVKNAFTDIPAVSKEGLEAVEEYGIKVPFSEQFAPKNAGNMYMSWSQQADSPLSKLISVNSEKVKSAVGDVRQRMLNVIDEKYKKQGIAAGMNLARELNGKVADDIIDSASTALKMAADGADEQVINKAIKSMSDSGITAAKAAEMSAAEIKKQVLAEQGDVFIMPLAERARAMKRIVQTAREIYRKNSADLFDGIREKANGIKVHLGEDIGPEDGNSIEAILTKYYGNSPISQKSKSSAAKAVEAELTEETSRSAVDNAIEPLLNKEYVDFNELHRLRMDLDDIFPKRGGRDIKALTEIRQLISDKMAMAAEEAGFVKEFRAANKYYSESMSKVESEIYRKIVKDEGLLAKYSKDLLEGEGHAEILLQIAKDVSPETYKKAQEVMRNAALDRIVSGNSPQSVYRKLGRDVQQIVGKDYKEISDILKRYESTFTSRQATANDLRNAVTSVEKELANIKGLNETARNKINNLMVTAKETETGITVNPKVMKLAAEKELQLMDSGDSVLNGVLSTKDLEYIRDFAEGADAAMGRLGEASGMGIDSIKQAGKTSNYFASTGQVSKLTMVLGYLSAAKLQQRRIIEKLIDPDNATLLDNIGKAGAESANLARMATIRFMREAYEEENGQSMPLDEMMEINKISKEIFTQENLK